MSATNAERQKIWEKSLDEDWEKAGEETDDLDSRIEAFQRRRFERFCAEAAARLEADIRAGLEADKRRGAEDPPAVTAADRPNLYPPSIVLAVITFLSFFLCPARIAGTLCAVAVIWWVVVAPVVIIVTGGNAWQEFPDDSGRSGRPDA